MALLPHVDYFYDLTGANAYVLLNGSREVLRSVVSLLEENHIRSTGTGESRYPARTGVQYDWFIRVTAETGEKPQPTTIHSLLKGFSPGNGPDFQKLQSHTRELQKSLDELKKKQLEAAARLSKREAELERVRKKNRELVEEQANIELSAEQLRSQVEQLEIEVSLLREERERLSGEIQQNQEYISEFSADFDAQEHELRVLQQQYESVCAERNNLRLQLSEASRSLDSAEERRPSSAEVLMGETLHSLMPNVEFLKDSVEIIAARLANPQPVLEITRQIVFEKRNGGNVEGAKGWQEIRFNTGQDSSGRIYFKPGEGQYKILVSFKENQKPDIIYMKKL